MKWHKNYFPTRARPLRAKCRVFCAGASSLCPEATGPGSWTTWAMSMMPRQTATRSYSPPVSLMQGRRASWWRPHPQDSMQSAEAKLRTTRTLLWPSWPPHCQPTTTRSSSLQLLRELSPREEMVRDLLQRLEQFSKDEFPELQFREVFLDQRKLREVCLYQRQSREVSSERLQQTLRSHLCFVETHQFHFQKLIWGESVTFAVSLCQIPLPWFSIWTRIISTCPEELILCRDQERPYLAQTILLPDDQIQCHPRFKKLLTI